MEEMKEKEDRTIRTPLKIKINKWRVREGFPVNGAQVILLYEEIGDDGKSKSKILQKLRTTSEKVGVVEKRLCKEGDIVDAGAAVLELSTCVHATVIRDMCADCGADLRQNENGHISEASVPMVHSVPDLKVTQKIAQKLGHDDTRRLLHDRKLVLLVDLDQTVIHTTNDNVPNNIKGIYHFQLYGSHAPWYHTRLRPGTPQFLEHMSQFYELHICTFGARNYAHTIAQLLDPKGKFFSHRILSRDECFNITSKTDNLKALFPNGDSMVCIIDDREDVWNMASNLIQVKPYHFFQYTGDINAPPGLSKHELDGKGVVFKDENLKIDDGESAEPTANDKAPSADSEDSNETSEKTETVTEEHANNSEESSSIKACDTGKKDQTAAEEDGDNKPEQDIDVDGIDEPGQETTEVNEKFETKSEASSDVKEQSPTEEVTENKDTTVDLNVAPKIKLHADGQKQVEIEDPDDYLLYLEVILKNIHSRFYSIYDETQEIPDLKIIVPKIRSEVLRGQHLVFSGLVPTNMPLEQSRAYFIAKSLGANVSQHITPETTHVVAVAFTFKVNSAKSNPNIKVVNGNWLWSCAERWEHVEEKLFPLDPATRSKQRQPPAHCHSPEHVVNYSNKSEISLSSSVQQQNASEPAKFIDTINPLLSFSHADLADMNKEFDQFFESDSSSEDEPVNIENPPVDKTLRKRKREEREEERTRDFFTRSSEIVLNTEDKTTPDKDKSDEENEEDNDDDDDEMPSTKFRRGEVPSDCEMGSESNDSDNNNPDSGDDGDWNMMGAALEREFLGLGGD